jgi:hypothetical protein
MLIGAKHVRQLADLWNKKKLKLLSEEHQLPPLLSGGQSTEPINLTGFSRI